jgi:hypothetical protein
MMSDDLLNARIDLLLQRIDVLEERVNSSIWGDFSVEEMLSGCERDVSDDFGHKLERVEILHGKVGDLCLDGGQEAGREVVREMLSDYDSDDYSDADDDTATEDHDIGSRCETHDLNVCSDADQKCLTREDLLELRLVEAEYRRDEWMKKALYFESQLMYVKSRMLAEEAMGMEKTVDASKAAITDLHETLSQKHDVDFSNIIYDNETGLIKS